MSTEKVLKLIEVLKDTNFTKITVECDDINLHLSREQCGESLPSTKACTVPAPTNEDILKEENKMYLEQASNADDKLLEELIYDPDTAEDLIEQGRIVEIAPLKYKWVDKETLNA